MKTTLLIFLSFISAISFSQISFNTGSKELDADLNTINADAKTDLGGFKTSLSAEFSVSTKTIDGMFSIGMAPGEVYLSLEISKIAGKKIGEVVDCYKSNKGKGWGYIAKEMGIKPGSAEFHELKNKSKNKKNNGNNKNKGHNHNHDHGNSKGKKK